MHISKVKISAEASGKLKIAAQRSGLTPNLLCRLAMMSSFEAGPLSHLQADLKDGQEFNAYTLFGANQAIYLDLLKYVETEKGKADLTEEDLLERLKHHIDRGIKRLTVRIKSPADVAGLLAGNRQ
ncbi:MAG: DNA sulfur modification protein DndE [Sphingorhabdus sp.]